MEQPADQRLDPAQRPPLVMSEPVCQRALPQLELQPGPLLRAQLLPRHRPFGPQRLITAVLPGPVPPPHRPYGDPQVICDLVDHIAGGEPPGGLQPQPLTPLLLGGRIPAPLRIPHTSVIRPQPPRRHDPISTSSSWLGHDAQHRAANCLPRGLPQQRLQVTSEGGLHWLPKDALRRDNTAGRPGCQHQLSGQLPAIVLLPAFHTPAMDPQYTPITQPGR